MDRIFNTAIIAFVNFIFFTNYASAEFPGVTPGHFSVTDSGSASYSLPISMPAGVAGMSPELAVTYNSSTGNGMLGVGFGLSGFSSSIHRCGGSHATDGRASGITYTTADKLCLNGQRLVLVKGTPWVNGAEYRSEVERYSRIVYEKIGATERFRVNDRDGEATIYGWRVLGANHKVLRWLKSSEHDRSNNLIRYFYQHIGEAHWLPKEVTWTGKDTDLGNRKAIFRYKDRPDRRVSYEYGVKRAHNKLLDTITTYIGTTQIKQYKFLYHRSPVSGLSRLQSIVQSGRSGGTLPAHQFSWKNTARGFQPSAAYKLPVRIYDYKDQFEIESQSGDFVDVNNDGLVDYVVSFKDHTTKKARHAIYKNTGKGWQLISQKPPTAFVMRDFSIRKKNIQQGIYADVNGDGFPDIVRSYSLVFINGSTTTRKEVWLNNKNWTWTKSSAFVPPVVLRTYSAGWAAKRNTNIDTDQYDFREPYIYTPMAKAQLTDINGDGRVDWVVNYRNFHGTHRTGVWLNNGSKWVADTSYKLPAQALLNDYWRFNLVNSSIASTQFQDVNGDGLVDLIQAVKYNYGPNRVVRDLRNTWLNTGAGWKLSSDYKLPDFVLDYTRIGGTRADKYYKPQSRGSFVDVNGDGLVDWVRSYIDARDRRTYQYTWLNNGNGWSAYPSYNLSGSVINNYDPLLGNENGHPSGSFFDINRDGLVDWVVAHKNLKGTDVRHTYLNTGNGWKLDNDYKFPNFLIDNKAGWKRRPVHFGGLMDVNNDGAVDYVMSINNIFGQPLVNTYLGLAKPADIIVKITDSLGAQTGIIYKPMSDPDVYRQFLKPAEFDYRQQNVVGPKPLVSDTWQSNGIKGYYWLKYHYYQALIDGKHGSLGFGQRRVWDPQQKLQTIKQFYQSYPASGITKNEYVYKADNIKPWGSLGDKPVLLSAKSNEINVKRTFYSATKKKTYSPAITRSRVTEYELIGSASSPVRTVWTNTVYGAYRNPTQITAITQPGNAGYGFNPATDFRQVTQTGYRNDEPRWLIGLPTRVKVTHSAPNQATQTRTTAFAYDTRGLPAEVVIEPGKDKFRLTTTHSYDQFGNQIATTISGQGIKPRTGTVKYDGLGLHVREKTNALTHKTKIIPHPLCDAPQSSMDANGLVIRFEYDQFCRQTRTAFPDGTETKTEYKTNPLRVIQRATAQPTVTTFYDELSRPIKVETEGFDGRRIVVETQYNSKGQIILESQPYYAGETRRWTEYRYDSIGRLYLSIAADGSQTRVIYKPLQTTTINALGQSRTETADLLGRIIAVTDAKANILYYRYDAVGNLLKTIDPKGNEVKLGYDHTGRKIWMDDPNMGRWKYDYNVLGELIQQTDANGNVIKTWYDKLGRMIRRKTEEGFSYWKYDTAPNGIGLLVNTSGPGGYRRTHSYDQYSRPKTVSETIAGQQAHSFISYNSGGKVHELRYMGAKDAFFKGGQNRLIHRYNDRGYLTAIEDLTRVSGQTVYKTLWQANAMDALGRVTKERYGNGVNINRTYHPTRQYLRSIKSRLGPTQIQDLMYTQDAVGNLTAREDHISGARESFSYDPLNRLKKSKTTSGTQGSNPYEVRYNYDALGNIIYRSDVGSLNYGERGYGPHAVTSIRRTGSDVVPENTYNPYGNYRYDANGNLLQNGQRRVEWTSFNKPQQMAGIVGNQARGASYTYGPELQRITKRTLNAEKVIRYFGGGSSERINEDNKIFWKYYIPVGTATLEIKYREVQQNGQSNYIQAQKQYLFKDHLGSTDVVVDHKGTIKERLSFNPWGERRDADWTEASDEIHSSSTRGFTGHEMDDEMGLVNMNARIYDPVIGRFLSADPIIASPTDLQSYNRYSYVRNNPLSFTDPSGFERIPIPGRGGYSYDTDNGNFYQTRTYRDCKPGECKDSDAPWLREVTKVTDPGMINHLKHRIGVTNELIEHHGGLHRGTAKHLKNQFLQQARDISGCTECSHEELGRLRGISAEFDFALDRANAAADIYIWLKRKARKRYRKIAAQIFIVGISIGVGAHNAALAGSADAAIAATALTSTEMAVFQSAVTLVSTGGDIKAALVTAASFGVIGPELAKLDGIKQIAAHGVWGGISSEILGGGFVGGFFGASAGKAITVGSAKFFGVEQGDFHLGHFGATVAGGALAAELAGGDPVYGAATAAMGYLINHTQLSKYGGQQIGHDAVRDPRDRPPHSHNGGFDPAVSHPSGFAGPKEVARGGVVAACYIATAACIRGGITFPNVAPYTPFACAVDLACLTANTAIKSYSGEL